MEQQHPRLPAYTSHNPNELSLPSVPKTDINHAHATAELTLPDLKTVLSSDFDQSSFAPGHNSSSSLRKSTASGSSLPRIEPGPQYTNGERRSLETAITSPSEVGSAMSIDERGVISPSSAMEEDVRIAAEALSGLGNPDFIRSPRSTRTSDSKPSTTVSAQGAQDEPEPLIEIMAKAHPWVSGTINGSLSAYSTTMTYSPRFVQYGAKLIENKIAIPVVTTVGTVGRVTGVESGVRWYYGGQTRQSNDLESGGSEGAGMRKFSDEEMEDADFRENGVEPLPAYRASKPPSYREEVSPSGMDRRVQSSRSDQNQSWSTSVLVMTSGLGVALSVTSRRSLRHCLAFLARQAEHITTVMDALKMVLQRYDQRRSAWHKNYEQALEKGERPQTPDHDDAARALADIIQHHSEDIWRTLQTVVTSVSNYAGGALPDNARHFVKTQLMSLPHRWRFVSDQQIGESETSRGAHRMIAFATEGLDMMSQVSQTMSLTLESAEQWLERVGRRRDHTASPHVNDTKDHDMVDAPRERRDVEKQ